MIESPVAQRRQFEFAHEAILAFPRRRLGNPGRDITKELRKIRDNKRLIDLNFVVGECVDFAAFAEALSSI